MVKLGKHLPASCFDLLEHYYYDTHVVAMKLSMCRSILLSAAQFTVGTQTAYLQLVIVILLNGDDG